MAGDYYSDAETDDFSEKRSTEQHKDQSQIQNPPPQPDPETRTRC